MSTRIIASKKDILVTLGSIVFLLSNLTTVGGSGRRRAKEAVCLSNLRQWGTAFLLFAEDNDGRFMEGWTPSYPSYPPDAHKRYWMEALRSYYGNKHKLRCCPEAMVTGTELGLGPWGNGGGPFSAWGVFPGELGQVSPAWSYAVGGDYGSYGLNGYVAADSPFQQNVWWSGSQPENYWRHANWAGGDNIPLFGDHQFVDCWPHHNNEPPAYEDQPWNTGSQMGRVCVERHTGSVHWAFLDFSARKVGLKELWKLKWHREYDTYGPWTVCGGVQPQDWPIWMQDFQDY
jgi:hypothetical protein